MNRILKFALVSLSICVLAWLAFGFFGIQALFIDREVEEEIPESISELIVQSNNETTEASENNSHGELVGKGAFKQGDSTYTIQGNAFLSRIDGKLSLTFTDFEVSNGPDLFVYAVGSDNTENRAVKEAVASGKFITLGRLKGNIGDQSYELESKVSLSDYGVIAIWCRRFSRNFGSADLTSSSPSDR